MNPISLCKRMALLSALVLTSFMAAPDLHAQSPIPLHQLVVEGAIRAGHLVAYGSGIGGGSEGTTFTLQNSAAHPYDTVLRVERASGSLLFVVVEDGAYGRIFCPQMQNTTDSFMLLVDGNRYTGEIRKRNSSRRYKRNIEPFTDNFERLLDAELKTWTYKAGGQQGIGYVAEEIEALGLKNLVQYDREGRVEALHGMRFPYYLVEIAKRHRSRLDEQDTVQAEGDSTVAFVQTALLEAEARLQALEARVGASTPER